nr:hypothetical protein [Tanacetum cinerariifolium]
MKKFFGQGEQIHETLDENEGETLNLKKELQVKSTPTLRAWRLYLGKETIEEGSGMGIILVSMEERMHSFAIRLKFNTSDHTIDCEALLAGLAVSVSKLEPENLVRPANAPALREVHVSPPTKESTVTPAYKSLELSTNVNFTAFAMASEHNEEMGISVTLDDDVELVEVDSGRVSFDPNDVVVSLFAHEKGDDLDPSSVAGLVRKFFASDEFSRVQGELLSLASSVVFERGLSMHQTKDEFAAMLKKMINFMHGAQDRIAEAFPLFLKLIMLFLTRSLTMLLNLYRLSFSLSLKI